MRIPRLLLPLVLASAFTAVAPLCAASDAIVLNDREYFEGPGFSFLLFHNNYQVGHQGGLQMIQNGERILDSGDLLLAMKAGESPGLIPTKRVVDRANSTATIYGEIAGWNSGYQIVCRSDGRKIFVTLKLDKPLDWSKVARAGFRIELYPGIYSSSSYQGDSGGGVFPQQYTGRLALFGPTQTLRVAPENTLHSFMIARPGGSLMLVDSRADTPLGWFMVIAPFTPGSPDTEQTIEITPSLRPDWRRAPVIGVSQVGYQPAQKKRAVIELDPRSDPRETVNLFRLTLDGEKKLIKSRPAQPWAGTFLRYRYATFDFDEVTEVGNYLIEFAGQKAGPFRIAPDVYEHAWQPTLTYFLPVQMCHVAVIQGTRTWHGACHLDDAMQAPAHKTWIDGYEQAERETKFADNEHVPGLDWGGWHDAGDNDLPAGSIAITTLALALAQEEFRPTLDQTTVRRAEREVLLHKPDGRSDLLQQIEFGVESLIALYRPAGHVFPGIIENTGKAYLHLGDPVNITDNRIHDKTLKTHEVRGGHSGKFDDRWVFTNRNTGLQYDTAQTLAAASRALRGYRDDLADDSLAVAKKLWGYEQTHAPIYARSGYSPPDSGFRSQEIAATAELLLTTGEGVYRRRLLELLPALRGISAEQFGEGPGWTLVRVLPRVDNAEFHATVRKLAASWKVAADKRAAANPYGVRFSQEISSPSWKLETRSHVLSGFVWGLGWNLQSDAMSEYYFHKHLPELFGKEALFAVVNHVLGCHPSNNQSYVSGVGAASPLIAYGYNRADWSHIPGGVISGASLVKPDLLELRIYPFLWYQTEYVIGGAATYIFDLLAAQKLLGE
jgi:hypothetical protein